MMLASVHVFLVDFKTLSRSGVEGHRSSSRMWAGLSPLRVTDKRYMKDASKGGGQSTRRSVFRAVKWEFGADN